MQIARLITAIGTLVALIGAPPAIAQSPKDNWGGLASIVGTIWYGNDGMLDIAWDEPGKVMLVTKKSMWGETHTYVGLGSDGLLHYRYRDIYSKANAEGTAKPNKQIVLRSDADGTMICTVRAQVLNCDAQSKASTGSTKTKVAYQVSDSRTAMDALAKIGAVFPPLPKSVIDPQLGVLGLLDGTQWEGFLVVVGHDANGPTVQIAIEDSHSNFIFKAPAPGARLLADIGNATEKNPQGRTTADLIIGDGGDAHACYTRIKTRSCFGFWLSADRKKALYSYDNVSSPYPVDYTLGWKKISKAMPAPDTDTGLLANLNGRMFVTPSNKVARFTSSGKDSGMLVISPWTSWSFNSKDSTLICSILHPAGLCTNVTEHGSSDFPINFEVTGKDSFNLGGSIYRLEGDGSLSITPVKPGSPQEIYKPISAGAVAFIRQQVKDNDDAAIARQNRADSRARNEAFWSKVSGGVAAMQNQYGTWMANNPAFETTNWAARIGSTGPRGKPGSYAATVAPTRYVAMPPATPAQLKLEEDYERMTIRERLFGSVNVAGKSSTEEGDSPAGAKKKGETWYFVCGAISRYVEGARDQKRIQYVSAVSAPTHIADLIEMERYKDVTLRNAWNARLKQTGANAEGACTESMTLVEAQNENNKEIDDASKQGFLVIKTGWLPAG
jgi:hypothetical protein